MKIIVSIEKGDEEGSIGEDGFHSGVSRLGVPYM
jgi:hypothetical protein